VTALTLESLGRPLVHEITGLEKAALFPAEARIGQSVRCWVRSLDGVQKEGIALSSQSGRAWRFASDEGHHLGGRDQAPNPLGYVGVGMASAIMTELLALAKMRGLQLRNPVLTLENYYFRDGSFPKGTMISGALSPEVTLHCETQIDPDVLQALLIDATSASALNDLVRSEQHGRFTAYHNGASLSQLTLPFLDVPELDDPGDPIAALSPASTYLDNQPLAYMSQTEDAIIARVKTAPEPAPQLAGSKKLLHLRTTCRRRDDGVYECLREQFAQPSSSWTFLVDDRADQQKAIAPDSASTFAIGLVFCFMTQIGRFSHMAKLPLDGYRVIQDLHMSLGGASSGSGKAGRADPVETHVYLDSALDDVNAARVLEVAEQTCFLHALCRNKAKVLVRSSPH